MTNAEKVLRELSVVRSPKSYKCDTLKDKTPNEIKSLAHHYYSRARHAEAMERKSTDALREACAEIQRLRGLAYEMTEGSTK